MRPLRFHISAAAVAFAFFDALANELNSGALCRTAPKEQALHAAHHIFVFDTDGNLFAVFSFFRAEGTATQFFNGVRNVHLAQRGNVIKGTRADFGNAKLHFYGVKLAAVGECAIFDFLHVRGDIRRERHPANAR